MNKKEAIEKFIKIYKLTELMKSGQPFFAPTPEK